MNIARLVARLLVGLLFVFAGTMGFLITTPPALPGYAGTFNQVAFQSHWALFLACAQIAIGVLLLINRYVPVALIMLAAFLYNSFGFHITMALSGLWAPIVVTALGLLIAWPYRALFAPIFVARPLDSDRHAAAARTTQTA
jgi:putative oxidoreductase